MTPDQLNERDSAKPYGATGRAAEGLMQDPSRRSRRWTRAKATAIQAAPAAAGKSVATSKAKVAVVPTTASNDIPFPGGAVRLVDGQRVNMQVDSPKVMGGSNWPAFNRVLLETTLATIATTTNDPEAASHRIAAAAAALAAFKPADEIEAMLAGQAVALHFGALECLRRATLPDQHPEVASKLRRDGANLARGMTDMLEALDRKRGKGPQIVRVERVVVHEGGQAIVGNVQPAVSKVGKGQR
jgi:hypothetical protein